MTANYRYEVLDGAVLATGALRREPLLDPYVCGVRELDAPCVAVRVTLAHGSPFDGVFYPQTGEFGLAEPGAPPTWVTATGVEDGIERWLLARVSGAR
jgi:hypothetical protein